MSSKGISWEPGRDAHSGGDPGPTASGTLGQGLKSALTSPPGDSDTGGPSLRVPDLPVLKAPISSDSVYPSLHREMTTTMMMTVSVLNTCRVPSRCQALLLLSSKNNTTPCGTNFSRETPPQRAAAEEPKNGATLPLRTPDLLASITNPEGRLDKQAGGKMPTRMCARPQHLPRPAGLLGHMTALKPRGSHLNMTNLTFVF